MRLDKRTIILGITLLICCSLKLGCTFIANNGTKTQIATSKVTQTDIDAAISKMNSDSRTANFTQDQKDKFLQEYIKNLEEKR